MRTGNRKQIYRFEYKYLIERSEEEKLLLVLGNALKRETGTGGCYQTRSLYFDDYWNRAYEEKRTGSANRHKYRIRIYDYQDELIKLECKSKQGNYIYKESLPLKRVEYEWLINGSYQFLLYKSNSLYKKFYIECISNYLRPKVIVDYQRDAYFYGENGIRITFDHNVRAGVLGFDLFDPSIPTFEALNPNQVVLEVKFTGNLPAALLTALPPESSQLRTFSKYVLCCEKIQCISQKEENRLA